jgi:3-phenylpropionate/cinnamic acid dioxygenase small subunit
MSTLNGAAAQLELRDAENFLLDEAELLDQGRFEQWMDLFTPDGDYWVPATPDQDNPLDMVSLFYDDRPMMEARIRRLREPSNLVYNARTRSHHHISNVRVRGFDATDNVHLVSCYVLMVESRSDEQRVFSGACEYRLRLVDGVLKIVRKKVVLVNCDAMFGPLAIPF